MGKDIWKTAKQYCPNCGTLICGLWDGDGLAKFDCTKCCTSIVRKKMGRRHDRMEVYPKAASSCLNAKSITE